MPLPVRRVLVGLLLALLPALAASAARPAASAARPAGEVPPNVASVGNDFPLASGARLQANAWAGIWQTSWGATAVWVQTGNHVSGTWFTGGADLFPPGTLANPSSAVQMEGTVTGNVLQGTWTNSELAYPPWEGGTLELTLSADGNSLSGWWSSSGSGDPPYDITATHTWGGDTDTTPPAEDCSLSRAFPPPGVAKPATPDPDCTPPKVRAFPFKGFTKPGTRITLGYSVKDDSGHAKAAVTLYEGGQRIWKTGYNGKATGRKLLARRVPLAADLKSPMFFCVWAMDAAGNKSVRSPRSSCAWIKMVVPIERVSNGCGGRGWDEVVAVENYFGSTSTYYGEDGTPYEVDFTAACNLHDAGYGARTVYDEINGGPQRLPIDFHDWSRQEVDEKFRMDMGKLCDAQIPAEEQQALAECKTNFRYDTVRTFGGLFFDADPMWPGTQNSIDGTGTRSND